MARWIDMTQKQRAPHWIRFFEKEHPELLADRIEYARELWIQAKGDNKRRAELAAEGEVLQQAHVRVFGARF